MKEFYNNRTGFTLAEVLIALGIIGIVAAMTIPSLMQNISNKQLTTATNNFNRRFGEALRVMNSQGTLAGRKTTQGFLDEMSKVFKVAKVCDNTKLNQCFPKNITWGEKEVDTTTLKKSFNIVNDTKNWGTDVMGVQFANGVSALLAYNPDCKQDSGNNNLIQVGGNEGNVGFSTNNCLAMLYDVSSNKKPNKVGTDIQQTSNVDNLGGILANINGVKITKVVEAGSYDSIFYGQNGELTCDEFKAKYGIDSCCIDDYNTSYCAQNGDYWAGAVKACGNINNLASVSDLAKVAQYIYDNPSISDYGYINNIVLNNDKLNELSELGFSSNFVAWSNSNTDNNYAHERKFSKTETYGNSHGSLGRGRTGNLVICVKH